MKQPKSSGIFSRIRVQRQLQIIFFVAVFIPVLLLGNYLLYNTRTLLADHYREQSHSDNLRVKSILLDLTSNIYNKSRLLADDKDLISLLSTDFSDSKTAGYSHIFKV